MSCIIYMMSCDFAIHATCLLALTTYKYSELKVSSTTKKLNCKANCKTPFCHSDWMFDMNFNDELTFKR